MDVCPKCREIDCVCGTKYRSMTFKPSRDVLQEWAESRVKKECKRRGLKLVKGSVKLYVNPHNGNVEDIEYRTKEV